MSIPGVTKAEHTYATEREAYFARRVMIQQGVSVSLVVLDPSRNLYVFNTYGA